MTDKPTAAGAAPPGRPTGFDKERYKKRNVVERANNRLKSYRAVATRYDCEDIRVPLRAVA